MVETPDVSQGRDLMAQAWEELERGDLRQASEKAWGAASQMVKAAAEIRRWDHQSRGDLHNAVRLLAVEMGDRSFRLLFNTAECLHQNFYEGWLPAEVVREDLENVSTFVERMERIVAGGRGAASCPSRGRGCLEGC